MTNRQAGGYGIHIPIVYAKILLFWPQQVIVSWFGRWPRWQSRGITSASPPTLRRLTSIVSGCRPVPALKARWPSTPTPVTSLSRAPLAEFVGKALSRGLKWAALTNFVDIARDLSVGMLCLGRCMHCKRDIGTPYTIEVAWRAVRPPRLSPGISP